MIKHRLLQYDLFQSGQWRLEDTVARGLSQPLNNYLMFKIWATLAKELYRIQEEIQERLQNET